MKLNSKVHNYKLYHNLSREFKNALMYYHFTFGFYLL